MGNTMMSLGEVLAKADALNWRHALYLPFTEVWTEATSCAVIDREESEEPDEVPTFANEHGLEYALLISTVQDIVANARLQKPCIEISDLMRAFRFYYDHDAFIVFSSP
jgi:hypothetical protein